MSTTRRIKMRALRLFAAVTIAIGVMLPAAALAQTDPYPTVPTNPPVVTTTPTPGGVSASETTGGGGSLPVTGGQIAGLTLIGLGVIGAGVVMVRLGRRPARVES